MSRTALAMSDSAEPLDGTRAPYTSCPCATMRAVSTATCTSGATVATASPPSARRCLRVARRMTAANWPRFTTTRIPIATKAQTDVSFEYTPTTQRAMPVSAYSAVTPSKRPADMRTAHTQRSAAPAVMPPRSSGSWGPKRARSRAKLGVETTRAAGSAESNARRSGLAPAGTNSAVAPVSPATRISSRPTPRRFGTNIAPNALWPCHWT